MENILVSACLIGRKVRYDGGDCLQENTWLQKWMNNGQIVLICPEMAGGLTTPRAPAEIVNTKVITNTGKDVTAEYIKGAKLALELCKQHKIKFALLKASSPSCGNEQIYDGTFTSYKINGQGVTASLLTKNNIKVFNETEIEDLAKMLNTIS